MRGQGWECAVGWGGLSGWAEQTGEGGDWQGVASGQDWRSGDSRTRGGQFPRVSCALFYVRWGTTRFLNFFCWGEIHIA